MSKAEASYRVLAVAGVILPVFGSFGQPVRYDFSSVTALGNGALVGENVNTPIPGFEIMLLKAGQLVYRRSFGTWFNGRVANADSATKTLSGALIMSLVDSSTSPFSLDTQLSDYIPAFDGLAQSITSGQGFAHISGLRDSNVLGDRDITLQEAAIEIANSPLRFVPGTEFYYGGAGMHASGAVAELAGGAPWNELFEERIAGPLGMTVTRYVLSGPENPRIAGGCESNAPEFARFMEMLRNDGMHQGVQILTPGSVEQLFTRQTPIGIPVGSSPLDDSADYGVGVWLDQRDKDGNLIGALAAGARGFSSWVDFDDGTVGVFATDLSATGNVQTLLYLIRDAAEKAVRNPLPCRANFNGDEALNSQDFFDFLGAFFAGDADYNVDGETNSQDFFDFLLAFFIGCD